MKGITVEDSYVNQILEANDLGKKIEESKVETQEKEVVEEAQDEDHSCPLCESKLDEALTDDRLQEFVEYALEVIDEALEDENGDTLAEGDKAEAE